MSPAKVTKSQKSKTLTIEFAGICTFLWDRKKGYADVRLVDLGSAGFQRHYAALGLAVNENTPRAVRGPDADAATSLPAANTDVGLWNLTGTDVTIVGATGSLSVDDSKVDVTKRPAKTAESIRWLADIGYLTESVTLDPICPISATIRIPAGRVTANARVGARKVEFTTNGNPVGPARFCVPRLKAVIPFAREIAIVLDRRRALRFTESMAVTVSNTCVCALGLDGLPDHFYAHYDLVEARRRPKVEPAGPQPMTASYPEFCYMGYLEI